MPKTSEQLVDLLSFRKRNGLLQQDIADFLDVSRGYISMVEKGHSKLSKENIDKILGFAPVKQWDTRDLVPAETRLREALSYYNRHRSSHDSSGNPGGIPPMLQIESERMEKIRYGMIGISDSMADILISKCPELNRRWLLTGEGKMLKDKGGLEVEYIDDRNGFEELKEMINDLKAYLEQMIDQKLDQTMDLMMERMIKVIQNRS